MNYPEPVGVNPLHRPEWSQITEILARSKPSYSYRVMDDEPEAPHTKRTRSRLGQYLRVMRERGGWVSAKEMGDELNTDPHTTQNLLARYVKRGNLQRRFRPDGVKEYGPK